MQRQPPESEAQYQQKPGGGGTVPPSFSYVQISDNKGMEALLVKAGEEK